MSEGAAAAPEQPQKLTSKIKVLVRLRPCDIRTDVSVIAASPTTLIFSNLAEGPDASYEFDGVLGQGEGQAPVFSAVSHIVRAVVEGHNGTIMTYGQTGSGKTHTLIGDIFDPLQRGVVPRAATELFALIRASQQQQARKSRFAVHASAVEIYCERIRDLLCFSQSSDNLSVQQDKEKGVYVAGAKEHPVETEDELLQVMQQALGNRAVASTGMNATSSRSHCLVTLLVSRHWLDGSTRVENGKLCLVDLAGSERQARTNVGGGLSQQTLEEGKLINKSLSTLGNVVSALTATATEPAKKVAAHVPYRDSKLTRVLQDSLGGTAQVALIVCCSPAAQDASETLSALRFGTRAAGIVNSLQVHTSRTAKLGAEAVRQLEICLEASQQECRALEVRNASLVEMLAKHAASDDAIHADVVATGSPRKNGWKPLGLVRAEEREIATVTRTVFVLFVMCIAMQSLLF